MKDSMLFIIPPHPLNWKALIAGVAYLAAVLEKAGIRVEVLDCQIEDNYKAKILGALSRHHTVGISINVATITNALEISRLIRQASPHTRIIMGGPHPSVIYDKLIPAYADIVAIGEGEETILELMRTSNLAEIKGIAFWQDGKIKLNPRREFIDDLDSLPYPAWHLFKLERYNTAISKYFAIPVYTSRGCPYRCIFCSKEIHGQKMRLRELDKVINEIEYLFKVFKMKEIHLCDENFTFYPERVKQFSRKIIAKKFKGVSIYLASGIRADKGDMEMFKLLKQAGCYGTPISIESGSQEVLDRMGKNLDLQKAKETILMAKKAGLFVVVFFMLGFPFETIEDIQKTIEFSKTLPVEIAIFFMALPMPGTELYNIVKKEGRFLLDVCLAAITKKEAEAYFETDKLKGEVVAAMCKKAFREFYLRPIQIWRLFFGLRYYPHMPEMFAHPGRLLSSLKEKVNYFPMPKDAIGVNLLQ